jgi:hypothetical protein
MSKFASRKFIVTMLIVGLVVVSEALGVDLDDDSLTAIVTMGLGLLGSQGLVDVAHAIRAGKKVAGAVDEVREVSDADEP